MRQVLDVAFHRQLNDVLSLHKSDGRVIGGIKAHVSASPQAILIMDVTVPIEVGDKLVRELPNGTRDEFVVDDPRYVSAVMGIPAHFQTRYHRLAPAASGGTTEGFGASSITHLRAPVLRYQYPPDLPAPEQLAIEEARLEANTQLEGKSVGSYDEHRAARVEWFWRVVSAAAEAIGRAGTSLQWSANRRRESLRDFGLNAAQAARIAGPGLRHFEELCESPEWHALDDRLLTRFDAAKTGMPAENRKRSQKGKVDATVQRIKKKVRELRKEGLDYSSICDRLQSFDRPPRAGWRELPWPIAYRKHNSAVMKWLSEACSDNRS